MFVKQETLWKSKFFNMEKRAVGVIIKNKKLKEAWDFFDFKIKELGQESVNFYRKLRNQTELIRLDIGHAKDAYKLFETINIRGLKLSAADIVKNFLLGHASILGEEILEDVKEEWRHLILNLDKLGYSDMDKFFRQYLMGKFQLKISKSRLIEEFKNYYYLNIQESEKLSDYQSRLDLMGRKKHRSPDDNGEEYYEDNGEDDIAKNRELAIYKNFKFPQVDSRSQKLAERAVKIWKF